MKTDLFNGMALYEDFPGCCGIQVHCDFPLIEDVEFADLSNRVATHAAIVEDMIEEFGKPRDRCQLISLIDSQLQQGWLSIVQKAGFRRIARFRNGPNGNIVNLFAHVKTEGVPAYKGKAKTGKKGGG